MKPQALSAPSYVPLGERLTLTIPLTASLSKNFQHGLHRGQIHLQPDAEAARAGIGWELKSGLRGRVLQPQRKVWLDLFVQRANMKSDPINVLDAVADAVKGIVGLDDRWFAVARLDWALVREETPCIRLALWQDADPEGD